MARALGTPVGRAGVLIILADLGFIAVFGYLAATFDYPQVLDHGAAEVLPKLLGGGTALRLVWGAYAALPVAVWVSARLTRGLWCSESARMYGRQLWFAKLAAVCMTVGLVRWSTLNWALAEAWVGSEPARDELTRVFGLGNLVLGKAIGEFAGELALNAWLACWAWLGFKRRSWLGWWLLLASALGWLAALRNLPLGPLHRVVSLAADVNNSVLPLDLALLGGWLVLLASRPAQHCVPVVKHPPAVSRSSAEMPDRRSRADAGERALR